MGANNCSCDRDITGDDFFYQTFDSLNLRKLDVRYVYKEFIGCVSEIKQSNKDIPTLKLNEKRFSNFLSKIVSGHDRQIPQTEYFKTVLLLSGNGTDAIKRIGSFLILNSDGSYIDKLAILKEHVSKYYGKKERKLKEFVYDVVLMNTEMCLIAFENYLEKEAVERYRIIWKKQRIEKYILNTFSKYDNDYAISTRNSYYKNVELQREKNSYQNSTTNIVDSFYTSENVDNLNEKNESKQRNGTMNSTPEGMIQIHNINNTTNNPHDIKTNILQIGNVGNNQEYFYRYMNFLLLELQGENIRTGINNIFLSDTSGASLEKNIAGN
jgi:hypothetical protein